MRGKDDLVVLVAEWRAAAGKGDEVARVLEEVVPMMWDEEGVLLYLPNRDVDDPDHFLLYEHYPDQATREAHRDTEHFKRYIEGTIWPMLDERTVTIYSLVGGAEVGR